MSIMVVQIQHDNFYFLFGQVYHAVCSERWNESVSQSVVRGVVMTMPDLFLGLVNTPILVQPLPSS